MKKTSWTSVILIGVLTAVIAGCGGGNSSPAPTASGYVHGPYSGTLIDGSNIFGQGIGATAVFTYNDTSASPNGNLAFGTGASVVNIPIDVTTSLEPTSVAFTITKPSNPDQFLIVGFPGLTLTATNTYGGFGTEYSYANGATSGTPQSTNATISVVYQGITAAVRRLH